MVSDRIRTGAFAAAIREVVQPGDVVLDVGTGTGILAMFAAQAGAKQVYAIDATEITDVASKLASMNGLSDRIQFLRGSAGELQLDTKIDLLISEWLGHAVFAEGMLHAVLDTRDHNLAPSGRMLPAKVRVLIAPLDSAMLYNTEGPGFWREPIFDLDFSSLQQVELSQGRATQLQVDAAALLALGERILELDLHTASVGDVSTETQLEFVTNRDGELNGFCVWFEADLSPNVTLDTGPFSPVTHWAQTYVSFPPRPVRAGERLSVRVDFSYDPDPVAISRYAGLCLGVGEHQQSYLLE
jgi:SAM-dependent methyltransferase